jgi:hypothetical protein
MATRFAQFNIPELAVLGLLFETAPIPWSHDYSATRAKLRDELEAARRAAGFPGGAA